MDLPPQVMKDQVRSLAARHDAELIGRGLEATDPGRWPNARGGQALPVLQAFHEFLEVERRRTRTRMLVLTGIFLLLLLCIVGAGILSVVYFTRSMDGEMSALQAQLEDARKQSGALHTGTETKLAALSGDAAELRRQVVGAQAAMDAVRKDLAAGASGQADQLAGLRKLLASVEQQNAVLASDLNLIGARLQKVPALSPAPVMPPSAEPEEATPPLPEEFTPPSGERWIHVAVMPPGAEEEIPLLLPIPE